MKKSEYLSEVQRWREHWVGVFSEGVPGPEDNPELLWDCVLTCDNEDCSNYGFYWWDRVQENLDGVYRVMCGLCGAAVTDIDPLLEDDEDYRFNYRLPDGRVWNEEEPR